MTIDNIQQLSTITRLDPNRDRAVKLMEDAILSTMAYADVFDYPLTLAELHRYLIGVATNFQTIERFICSSEPLRQRLSKVGGYYCLHGREDLVQLRLERARLAANLWLSAQRYGRIIALFPFVRMVAVTGSLAMDNPGQDGDIDYMIVTSPGRVWLCRAMVIALVHWAALSGNILCPNLILSSDALTSAQRNLYIAHEITQLVPLSGAAIYFRLRELNTWVYDYLPNATDAPPRKIQITPIIPFTLTTLIERSLSGGIGLRLEKWEMRRKMKRFARQYPNAAEAAFCADWCMGYFDGHGYKSMKAYHSRLEQMGINVGISDAFSEPV